MGDLRKQWRDLQAAPWVRYAVAVLSVLCAWALRTALDPLLYHLQPLSLFYGAVLLIGWWAGPGPATLAAILGYLTADWFFFEPRHTLFEAKTQEISAGVVYALISAGMILATHSLRRACSRVEVILNSVTDAFFAVDSEWRFTFVNPAAEWVFQRSSADMLGKNIWRTCPISPFLQDHCRQKWEEAVATRQPVHFECEHDRLQACFEVHAYPYGDGLAIYLRDITYRKRAEQSLERSRSLYRAIAANVPDGAVAMVDRDLRFILAEGPLLERIGLSTKIMENHTISEVFDQEMVQLIEPRMRSTFAGESRSFETPIDGLWLLTHYVPLRDSESHVYAVLTLTTDISERKRSQDELLRAKDSLEKTVKERTSKLRETIGELEQFSYTLTHDMRAPLRAMKGFAQILIDEPHVNLTPDEKELVTKIIVAAARMDSLVRDALNYNKLLREELDLEPVDVDALLHGMIESYPAFSPSQIEILIISPLLPVTGNQAALTQCFSNLINNAVKSAKPGQKPQLMIRSEEREGVVRLWFEDRGLGTQTARLEQSPAMSPELEPSFTGTSLGLAVVRKAVERMGGSTGMESHPGIGNCVWLDLKRPALEEKHDVACELVRL